MPELRYRAEPGEPVSSSAIEILQETTFSESEPGSVVADADILLEYVVAKKMSPGGKSQQLPIGRLEEINSILSRPLAHGLKRPQQRSLPNISGLYLLLRAGWIEIEYYPAEKGKGPQIQAIRWLPLGHAMAELINHYWLNHEVLASTGDLCADETALLAYFVAARPELGSLLPPDEQIDQHGTFVWRESVGPVWRRLELSSTSTLEALAEAILAAYDFDNEHLYSFEMKDSRGRELRFDHPFCESHNRMVHETELGQLPVRPGSTVTFWYDFGDDWRFELLLEAVRDEPPLAAPKVTGRSGKSPQQYSVNEDWY